MSSEWELKVLEHLATQTAMLTDIRNALCGVVEDACAHPEEARLDLSSMGHKHVRCKACGVDLINTATVTSGGQS